MIKVISLFNTMMMMMMIMLIIVSLLCTNHHVNATRYISFTDNNNDIILTPTTNKSATKSSDILIFIPADLIETNRYVSLLSKIQNESSIPLYIGIVDYKISNDNDMINDDILRVIKKIQNEKMNDHHEDKTTTTQSSLYIAGQSIGGRYAEKFVLSMMSQDKKYVDDININLKGLLLLSSALSRKNYYPMFSFPVRTLIIAAELDGISRVTRTCVESIYNHGKDDKEGNLDEDHYPVALIKGMSFWQFIQSGEPNVYVMENDLKPVLSNEIAFQQVSDLINEFITGVVVVDNNKNAMTIKKAVAMAKSFSEPIIKAYELEGSRHFNTPIQIGGSMEKNGCNTKEFPGACPGSVSEWTITGQRYIAQDVTPLQIDITNEYVESSSSNNTGGQFHNPVITNDSQTIFVSTYSQGYWDLLDERDDFHGMTSGAAIASKMASRQCIQIAKSKNTDVPFALDDGPICGEINKLAYEKAQDLLKENAVTNDNWKRFMNDGTKFVFENDKHTNAGPLFLSNSVVFKPKFTGKEMVVEVTSNSLMTEYDYWHKHFGPIPKPSSLPDPSCQHYCKLMSPARAMEWILVDSLRNHVGISDNQRCRKCTSEGASFCWMDGKCHSKGSVLNPCSSEQCVGDGSKLSSCKCTDCSDATCFQKTQ